MRLTHQHDVMVHGGGWWWWCGGKISWCYLAGTILIWREAGSRVGEVEILIKRDTMMEETKLATSVTSIELGS